MSTIREIIQDAYDINTELNRMNTADVTKAVDTDEELIKQIILRQVRKAIKLTWHKTGEGFNGEWSQDDTNSIKMITKDVLTEIKKGLQ